MKPHEDMVQTTLRLPRQLLDRIKHAAIDSRRSLNNEILTLIERAMEKKQEQAQ